MDKDHIHTNEVFRVCQMTCFILKCLDLRAYFHLIYILNVFHENSRSVCSFVLKLMTFLTTVDPLLIKIRKILHFCNYHILTCQKSVCIVLLVISEFTVWDRKYSIILRHLCCAVYKISLFQTAHRKLAYWCWEAFHTQVDPR